MNFNYLPCEVRPRRPRRPRENPNGVSFQMLLAIARLRLLYSRLRWVVALYDRLLGRVIVLEPATR